MARYSVPGSLIAVLLALAAVAPAARAVTISESSAGITAGAAPARLAAGPDGNVWFTELNRRAIGRITPGGAITEFAPLNLSFETSDIAAGRDGNLWFTENGPQIGRITPSGAVAEYPVVHSSDTTLAIAAGPDGNVWFTEAQNRIGRITPSATVTEFPVPTANAVLTSIAAGHDGNLWFTEYDANKIGRITPSGTITEFSSGISPDSGLVGIAPGPGGDMWFVEQRRGRLAHITSSGIVIELGTGTAVATGALAVGRDDMVWFTSPDAVARREPDGALRGFSAGIGMGAGITDIVAGPDGNLWFTELQGNRIGRARLDAPIAITGGVAGATTSAATVTGDVDPRQEPTSAYFEYGPTLAYGASTPPVAIGDGDAAVPVSAGLADLAPGTAYHFRLVAVSAAGAGYGRDLTLATAPLPVLAARAGDADGDGVAGFADRCPSTSGGAFDRDRDGCVGPYRRITSTPTGSWSVSRSGVRIDRMHLPSLPRGARVKLSCRTCHVKQTLIARHATLQLKRLRHKLLRRDRGFTVTVTRRGYIGERLTLTVKRYGHRRKDLRRVAPHPFKTKRRCIPVGSTRFARRCTARPPSGP